MLILIAIALAAGTASSLHYHGAAESQLKAEGRISNGRNALPGEVPYQVGIEFRISRFGHNFCGGVLIDPRWVLTAAHCATGLTDMIIFLGIITRSESNVFLTVPKYNLIIHKDFELATHKNDIALILIPKVKISAQIGIVRLPAVASSYSNYESQSVIVSGWGKASYNDVDYSTELKLGRMKIISNTACAKDYGPIVLNSHICAASHERVSTCEGDSGGPAVLESDGTLVGISSFGALSSCDEGLPIVFTRITSYLKWIKLNTGIN